MKKMTYNIRLKCAGVSEVLLGECGDYDIIRHKLIGSFVIAVSFAAFLAFYYFAYATTANAFASLGIGAIGCMLIFNTERFLLSSLPLVYKANKENQDRDTRYKFSFLHVLPQIIFALAMGAFYSVPLELFIFKNEISQKIEKDKAFELGERIMRIAKDESSRIEYVQKRMQFNQDLFVKQKCEKYFNIDSRLHGNLVKNEIILNATLTDADGTKPVCGNACKNAKKLIVQYSYERDKNDMDLKSCRENSINEFIADASPAGGKVDAELITRIRNAARAEELDMRESRANILPVTPLRQYVALTNLAAEDPNLKLAIIMLSSILIFIQSLPVLAKYSAGPTQYDFLAHREKIKYAATTRKMEAILSDNKSSS